MFRRLDDAEAEAVRPWRPATVAGSDPAPRTAANAGRLGRPADAVRGTVHEPRAFTLWPGFGAGPGAGRDGAARTPDRTLDETPDQGRDRAPDQAADQAVDQAADPGPDALERLRTESFDAGFAAGNVTARDAFADDVADLARAFARETAMTADALEAELLALARAMAACAVRRELTSDAGLYGNLVREAVEQLGGASDGVVTVRLHPIDAELLGHACGPDVNIVPDASLARCDCRLERGPSRIDASVFARLEACWPVGEAADAADAGDEAGSAERADDVDPAGPAGPAGPGDAGDAR